MMFLNGTTSYSVHIILSMLGQSPRGMRQYESFADSYTATEEANIKLDAEQKLRRTKRLMFYLCILYFFNSMERGQVSCIPPLLLMFVP